MGRRARELGRGAVLALCVACAGPAPTHAGEAAEDGDGPPWLDAGSVYASLCVADKAMFMVRTVLKLPRDSRRRERCLQAYLEVARSRGQLLPDRLLANREDGELRRQQQIMACNFSIYAISRLEEERAAPILEGLLLSDQYAIPAATAYLHAMGVGGIPRVARILEWGDERTCRHVFELLGRYPSKEGMAAVQKLIEERKALERWRNLVGKAEALLRSLELRGRRPPVLDPWPSQGSETEEKP